MGEIECWEVVIHKSRGELDEGSSLVEFVIGQTIFIWSTASPIMRVLWTTILCENTVKG